MSRLLPHFLGVGAPKCGTTSLHDILSEHPQIELPSDKELHFFDNPEHHKKGLDWYAQHFSETNKVRGEFTPAYMSYPETPERIFNDVGPDVKLIFMFREPVERAFSEYQHNYRRGLVNDATFEAAVERELSDTTTTGFDKRLFSFIERGRYADQVERFLKFFPRENMHFIRFREDFIADKENCIREVQQFLGVDVLDLDIEKRSNAAFNPKSRLVTKLVQKDNPVRSLARKVVGNQTLRKRIRSFVNSANVKEGAALPKLSKEIQQELQQKFYPNERTRLEQLIGKELPSWG